MTALWLRQEPRYDVSSQFFGESLAVAGLLTEPRWLGQETGHSHPGL